MDCGTTSSAKNSLCSKKYRIESPHFTSNSSPLQACCVEHIILESDNLSALFPNAQLNLGAYELNSHHLFAVLTAIAVLPTVWLRDLSVLSYISGKCINVLAFA